MNSSQRKDSSIYHPKNKHILLGWQLLFPPLPGASSLFFWSYPRGCFSEKPTHLQTLLLLLFFCLCSVTCKILVPLPGIEPHVVEAWNPNHWTAGEVLTCKSCINLSWDLKVTWNFMLSLSPKRFLMFTAET